MNQKPLVVYTALYVEGDLYNLGCVRYMHSLKEYILHIDELRETPIPHVYKFYQYYGLLGPVHSYAVLARDPQEALNTLDAIRTVHPEGT